MTGESSSATMTMRGGAAWIAWRVIIRALPLTLDLNPLRWGGMAEARVNARQRAFPDFGPDLHLNAQFLVGRRIRDRIGCDCSSSDSRGSV
jgi:hypothetical protein